MAVLVTRMFRMLPLIVICSMASSAFAVVFEQCYKDIRANKTGQTGGVDSAGNPVPNITDAVGITYERCIEWCSSAPENFDFPTFSRKFTAWLLPWLALISQLPFNGSNSKEPDLLSVVLAVGSPTLAGYSLALTASNTRWLHKCIMEIQRSPDSVLQRVERVLNHFQTMRLEIGEEKLKTVVTVDHELPNTSTARDGGKWWIDVEDGLDYAPQGFISAATALGWVFVAYVFTVIDAFTSLQTVEDTYGLGPGISSNGISDGQGVGSIWLWLLAIVIGWLIIAPKYQHDLNTKALETANNNFGHDVITMFPTTSVTHANEIYSAPIFNYARFTTWTADVETVLKQYDLHRNPPLVNPPRNGSHLYPPAVDQDREPLNQPGKVGHGYFGRFLRASLAGLTLQWGTAGGAVIIHWFTPTTGLGCRSLNWLLYAGASTLVWMILLTSSHLSTYHDRGYYIKPISDSLCVLGQLIAVCNAVGIIVTCAIQFGNYYSRCYCNNVMLANKGYDVFWVRNVGDIKRPWVGGVALGVGSAVLFLVIIWVSLPDGSKPAPHSTRTVDIEGGQPHPN